MAAARILVAVVERRWFRVPARWGWRAGRALSLVAAVLWTVVVVVWPRLPLSDTDAGRGWQASADGTITTIVAAVVVLLLTVGLVGFQVLSPFSSRALRLIVDRWFILGLLVVSVLGVAVPLVVAADPRAAWTRWAFVGFGWALALIIMLASIMVGRVTPQALVHRAVSRAVSTVARVVRGAPGQPLVLDSHADVLIELAGAAGLADIDRRKAGVAAALVIATRARIGPDTGAVMGWVEGIASVTERANTPTQVTDLVGILAGLGIDLAASPGVYTVVAEALRGIASRARTAGHRDVARRALDALAEVTCVRLAHLLPPDPMNAREQPLSPRKPGPFAELHRRIAAGTVTAPADPDAGHDPEVVLVALDANEDTDTLTAPNSSGTPPSASTSVSATSGPVDHADLLRIVGSLATSPGVAVRAVADALATLDPVRRRRSLEIPTGPAQGSLASLDAYDLLYDTVTTFAACVAAPHPDSTGWPDGWQGTEAFGQDVARIASLARSLYRERRYSCSGIVEETLEDIAQRLRAGWTPSPEVPPDRTGWRLDTLREDPGPATVVAHALGPLVSAAFKAGFDERALTSGRRLLAAVTAAAQDGYLPAVESYSRALEAAMRDISRHHPYGTEVAHQVREATVLAGLIAEVEPLAAAGLGDPRVFKQVNDLIDYMAWSASGAGNPALLEARTWRSRLAAAGWSVAPDLIEVQDPASVPVVQRLPDPLATLAEQALERELRHGPVLAAALIITLWANAVAALRGGDRGAADRLHDLITTAGVLVDGDDEPRGGQPFFVEGRERPPGVRVLDVQVRNLCRAVVSWVEATVGAGPVDAAIPVSTGHQSLRVRSRRLLADPAFTDRRYHGLHLDGEDAVVVVEEHDGTRRLLRDAEACSENVFEWGYGGGGPYALANALVADALADLTRCPDCLGAAPLAAGLITCDGCRNTAYRFSPEDLARQLNHRVVTRLSKQPDPAATMDGADWTLTRKQLLTGATS